MEDNLYKLLSIYHRFPVPIKNILGKMYNLIPRSFRYGKFYSVYHNRINRFSQFNDKLKIKKYQLELLFNQVNNAVDSVEFYKKYPTCNSLETFLKYPIISKKTIKDNFSEFQAPTYTQKRIKTNTGGSSGNPMEFFLEKNISRSKEKAHFDWYWGQFGFKPNNKILMIRGMPLNGNKKFEYNRIDNLLVVSCYNINEYNIAEILTEINKFKPKFIHAYPSSLKIITKLLESHTDNIQFNVKAIFLGSEFLFEQDREYFNQFYKTHVVNWYGHSERLIHGGNCKYSNEYHFYPAYGYIELIDSNNNPITKSGNIGRIIATGFDNRAMPFIRYDTGDLGELSENENCECGYTGTSLKSINGRGQDFIVLSDQTTISVTAFIFGQHLEAFKRILEMQIIQHKIGEIEIIIVKSESFNSEDISSLKNTLLKSVNYKLDIGISFAESIPKTRLGKNIFFVSKI